MIRNSCLLIFAKKKDLPNAISSAEITAELGLHPLSNRNQSIRPPVPAVEEGCINHWIAVWSMMKPEINIKNWSSSHLTPLPLTASTYLTCNKPHSQSIETEAVFCYAFGHNVLHCCKCGKPNLQTDFLFNVNSFVSNDATSGTSLQYYSANFLLLLKNKQLSLVPRRNSRQAGTWAPKTYNVKEGRLRLPAFWNTCWNLFWWLVLTCTQCTS